MENNDANVQRIEAELQGEADRSGGIIAQVRQTQQRIAEIEAALTEKRTALEQCRQTLTAMTANAQGITKQFLELRTKESSLAADIAGREADCNGLEESMQQTQQRMEQLNADLSAGAARKHEAQNRLNDCRKELKKAQETVTAAKKT
jgi:uncharacterized protein YoxC